MTKQRKEKLLELLKQSSVAINGQALAEHFHVTRQIIPFFQPIVDIYIKELTTFLLFIGYSRLNMA